MMHWILPLYFMHYCFNNSMTTLIEVACVWCCWILNENCIGNAPISNYDGGVILVLQTPSSCTLNWIICETNKILYRCWITVQFCLGNKTKYFCQKKHVRGSQYTAMRAGTKGHLPPLPITYRLIFLTAPSPPVQ